jgi:hypothetical protein
MDLAEVCQKSVDQSPKKSYNFKVALKVDCGVHFKDGCRPPNDVSGANLIGPSSENFSGAEGTHHNLGMFVTSPLQEAESHVVSL